MSKFFEVTIQPAHGGFGEYQRGEINGEGWNVESDLLAECGEIFILGKDQLPDGVEDIRGRIRNEPNIVFATITSDHDCSYHGIVEIE